MDASIEQILVDMKKEHKINKFDLELMTDAMFRLLQINIESRSLNTVSLIHLGKWNPSEWYRWNRSRIHKDGKDLKDNSKNVHPFAENLYKGDSTGMVESNNEQEKIENNSRS